MIAVAVVAHPDDCLIFARPFIDAHSEFTWLIVYLTYKAADARAVEIAKYWHARNISTKFLGFVDTHVDMQTDSLSFSKDDATTAIIESSKHADLVLTHNEDGDYGHIHHKFVNAVVEYIDKPKVYFASTFNYTNEYTATSELDINKFPLHKEVLTQFSDLDVGRYIVTEAAITLIENLHAHINT